MTFVVHETNPTDAVEEAFFLVFRDRMADVPINNPALAVEAIDFQRWQGHWLGVLVTPWCMSLLLLPGKADGWEPVRENNRRFVHFPAGDFAFLGSDEEGLGEFQSCALFSPMERFATQADARLTARASMVALMQPVAPKSAEAVSDETKASLPEAEAAVSNSRRRFFAPFSRGLASR